MSEAPAVMIPTAIAARRRTENIRLRTFRPLCPIRSPDRPPPMQDSTKPVTQVDKHADDDERALPDDRASPHTTITS